jgi:glutaredoxin
MKKIALVISCFVLFWACQHSGIKQTKEIIVYGSDNCDHCVVFKAKLDSVGFNYDFRDVEFNERMSDEMVFKVRRSGINGGFSYPVLDVEGKILVAPELSEVLELM